MTKQNNKSCERQSTGNKIRLPIEFSNDEILT